MLIFFNPLWMFGRIPQSITVHLLLCWFYVSLLFLTENQKDFFTSDVDKSGGPQKIPTFVKSIFCGGNSFVRRSWHRFSGRKLPGNLLQGSLLPASQSNQGALFLRMGRSSQLDWITEYILLFDPKWRVDLRQTSSTTIRSTMWWRRTGSTWRRWRRSGGAWSIWQRPSPDTTSTPTKSKAHWNWSLNTTSTLTKSKAYWIT